MPKLTKAQRAKGTNLWNACNEAHRAVFQGAMNVRWNDAYQSAPAAIRRAYDQAAQDLRAFERALVNEGRGWFNNYGHFAESGSVLSPWLESA